MGEQGAGREVAWTAGIIDGEGAISLFRQKRDMACSIQIGMTHEETIHKLHRIFGTGTLGFRTKGSNWKDAYTLVVTDSKQIERILKLLLPDLVTKRQQAELMLEYISKCMSKYGPHNPIPEDVQFLRDIIYEELRDLNKRGK